MGLVIDHRRHAVIGIELQEGFAELIPTADIERHDPIRQPRFLQEDGDFLAIGVGQKYRSIMVPPVLALTGVTATSF